MSVGGRGTPWVGTVGTDFSGQVKLRGGGQGEGLRGCERPQLGAWKLQPHGWVGAGVRPSQNRVTLLVLSRVVPGPPL